MGFEFALNVPELVAAVPKGRDALKVGARESELQRRLNLRERGGTGPESRKEAN